jgi:hypothetical protein
MTSSIPEPSKRCEPNAFDGICQVHHVPVEKCWANNTPDQTAELRDIRFTISFTERQLEDIKPGQDIEIGLTDDAILSILADRQKAVERAVTHILMAKTEGLFDQGELFIKRKPIEQACIDLVGYKTYKAITEAATEATLKQQKGQD